MQSGGWPDGTEIFDLRVPARNQSQTCLNGMLVNAMKDGEGNIDWGLGRSAGNRPTEEHLNGPQLLCVCTTATSPPSTISWSSCGVALGYDAGGDTVSCGAWDLDYDGNHHLAAVNASGSPVAGYAYYASVPRLAKRTFANSPVGGVLEDRWFFYDPSGMLLEEVVSSTSSRSADYIYLGGDPIAMVLPGQGTDQIYAIATDHLGTPQILTNAAGAVVWKAEYEPYGAVTVDEDPDGDGVAVTMPLRLPRQYFDAETGWSYNWHRYYDPTLGRYLQADPISFLQEEQAPTPYAYAIQNPLTVTDRQGLFGDGKRRGGNRKAWGHSDFYGGDEHDYTREDYGRSAWYLKPWRHFRHVRDVNNDLSNAVNACNPSFFASLMHQGQDYFAHYAAGYRWWPLHGRDPEHWLFGHLGGNLFGFEPDDNAVAWLLANSWTEYWVKMYRGRCRPCGR